MYISIWRHLLYQHHVISLMPWEVFFIPYHTHAWHILGRFYLVCVQCKHLGSKCKQKFLNFLPATLLASTPPPALITSPKEQNLFTTSKAYSGQWSNLIYILSALIISNRPQATYPSCRYTCCVPNVCRKHRRQSCYQQLLYIQWMNAIYLNFLQTQVSPSVTITNHYPLHI